MITTNNRIVFRADGNNHLGLGHIVRSLALVEMLNNHFTCVFFTVEPSTEIKEMISDSCQLQLLPIYRSLTEEITNVKKKLKNTDIVVLDGYHFDEQYQREIRSLVHKLVAIDDKAEI